MRINNDESQLIRIDCSILKYYENVYHGYAGAYLIKHELGITDPDIIEAIKYHVTGHPNMNNVAKIVYIADKTENTRDFPGIGFCRKLSEISLDFGVLSISEATYDYLTEKNFSIHPLTKKTYDYFLKKVGICYYETLKNNYQSLR